MTVILSWEGKPLALKLIRIACILSIVVVLVQGIFALFYENVSSRWIAPVTSVGMALMFFLFLRRNLRMWRWVRAFTVVSPVISALFPPSEKYYGNFTEPARILVAIQSLVFLVVFFATFAPAVKSWFFESQIFDHTNDPNFHTGETIQVTYQKNFWDMVWFSLYQSFRLPGAYIGGGVLLTLIGLFVFNVLKDASYSVLVKI